MDEDNKRMRMDNAKLCPLLYPNFGACVEEKCAWWVEKAETPWPIPRRCIVQSLVPLVDLLAMLTHPIQVIGGDDAKKEETGGQHDPAGPA